VLRAAYYFQATKAGECYDVDGDGGVTVTGDVVAVLSHEGTQEGHPGWDPHDDLNRDGAVSSTADVPLVINQGGKICTP
jgi:hypothetical protein